MEAINQRDKYEGLKNKAQDKQKSDTLDLQKVLAGKTTIKTFFSRKPKEEEVGNLEKHIAQVRVFYLELLIWFVVWKRYRRFDYDPRYGDSSCCIQ